MYVQYVHDACMHGIALYRTAFSRLYFSFLTSQKNPCDYTNPLQNDTFCGYPILSLGILMPSFDRDRG